MSARGDRGTALSEYLQVKRAATSPQDVGLPDTGRYRRVPGLRREELAQLADVSVDYYTRLEQGRLTQPSDAVLEGIARALRLSRDERHYLLTVARPPERREAPSTAPVSPQIKFVLDAMDSAPALVLGPRMDVLGWNELGAALFVDFSHYPAEQRNLTRMVFLDPHIRGLYVDWADVAREFVAQLRMEATQYPDDPRMSALVEELWARDQDFRQWWSSHDVQAVTAGQKRMRHPIVGELLVNWEALQVLSLPDQKVVIHTAPEDAPTQEGFRFLASWHREIVAARTHDFAGA